MATGGEPTASVGKNTCNSIVSFAGNRLATAEGNTCRNSEYESVLATWRHSENAILGGSGNPSDNCAGFGPCANAADAAKTAANAMIALATALFLTAFPLASPDSLDKALDVALGAGGLNRQTATFDPVALAYYRTGLYLNPVESALASSPWQTPGFFSVVERDALIANGQPHKLLAAASRLTPFGSRRDLLGDPSAPFLQSNPDGSSLNRIIEKYRAAGLVAGQPESQGIVPDEAKRAVAILMDCALAQRKLYDATFSDPTRADRLRALTQAEAFNGGDPARFSEWLALAKSTEMGYLVAASQDFAATVNAVRPIVDSAGLIGNSTWRLATKWGDVVIQDGGKQSTDLANTFLVIDLGGDDTYTGGSKNWCSAVIDRSGNDSYLSDPGYKGKMVRDGATRSQQRLASGPARGFFGMAFVVDEKGDDLYRSAAQGFGSGTFGVGYLLDAEGKDVYDAYTNSLGYGFFGIGICEDLAGSDEYRIFTQGQGCGMTAGVGWLLDRRGDDKYVAEDAVLDFKSPQSAEHNASMSQGAGYGIRLDYVFGQSLAGGMGFLFDLEGDDTYQAGVFAQGCGYWMGIGGLWDRDGADTYQSVWYGQGSAAHFAIGYLQDDAGDDAYSGQINMTQGAGHDFSIGFLLEGGGNDKYSGASLALGAGNANGFGIFIDRAGDDIYAATGKTVLGNANETPEGSLRQLSLCLGLFLDEQGTDTFAAPDAPYAANLGKNHTDHDASGAKGIFWDQ